MPPDPQPPPNDPRPEPSGCSLLGCGCLSLVVGSALGGLVGLYFAWIHDLWVGIGSDMGADSRSGADRVMLYVSRIGWGAMRGAALAAVVFLLAAILVRVFQDTD